MDLPVLIEKSDAFAGCLFLVKLCCRNRQTNAFTKLPKHKPKITNATIIINITLA
jgi:hypothetical protein